MQVVQKKAQEAAEQARVLAQQASLKAVEVAGHASQKAVEVAGQASEKVKVLAHVTAEEAQNRLKALQVTPPTATATNDPEPTEEELLQYGLNAELVGFLQSLTYSTFSDFPVHTLVPDSEKGSGKRPSYKLNPWQERHALLSLKQVEQLHNLRFVLCPRRMDEDEFWMIYFALTKRYLPPEAWEQAVDKPVEKPSASASEDKAKDLETEAPSKSQHDHLEDDDDDAQLVELENDPELAAYLTEAMADDGEDVDDGNLGSDVDDLDDYISKLDEETEDKTHT